MKRAIQVISSDPAWRQGCGEMSNVWMGGNRFPMWGFCMPNVNRTEGAVDRRCTFNLMECMDNNNSNKTGIVETRKKWKLVLDAEGFSHDNININVKGKELTIEAKREDSAKRKFEFIRQYLLPENIKTNSLKSILDLDEGILQLEGEKTNAELGDGEKTISIKFADEQK